MRWNFIIIPALIISAGVLTAALVPLDGRLRALIVLMDVFAAIAVGLILLRAGSRR